MTRTDIIARAIELMEADSYHNWEAIDKCWDQLKAEYKHIGSDSIGDSVGPGWWLPLLEAFDEIESIMAPVPEYRFNIRQIKEKFGGLRFYWQVSKINVELDEDGDEVEDAVVNNLRAQISCITQLAEDKCEKLCETCGEPGELRSGGWLKTLCDKHARKHK